MFFSIVPFVSFLLLQNNFRYLRVTSIRNKNCCFAKFGNPDVLILDSTIFIPPVIFVLPSAHPAFNTANSSNLSTRLIALFSNLWAASASVWEFSPTRIFQILSLMSHTTSVCLAIGMQKITAKATRALSDVSLFKSIKFTQRPNFRGNIYLF